MSKPFENPFPNINTNGLISPAGQSDGVASSNTDDEPVYVDPYRAAVQDAFLYLAQGFANDAELSFTICLRNKIARSLAEKAIAEARQQIAAKS
jgi:hypothetical protein